MAQDPIDEFIALPKDQQLQTLQQLAPDKQDKLLSEIKTRKSKTDFTVKAYPTEGTYQMTGKEGTRPIPYSKVRTAAQLGYKMADLGQIRKYVADTAADPNINTLAKGGGVRIVGRNAAGEPILAPEKPAAPEGGAAPRLLSSFGGAIGGAASGLYHAVVEGPQNPEEAKWADRGLLTTYRMAIAPAQQQAQAAGKEYTAAQQAKTPWQRGAHGMRAAGHALATVIPGVGPAAAQLGEQLGTQIGTGDIAGAAGTAAGNVALYEAPHIAGGVARVVPGAARGVAEALTETGPRGLREMAKKTVKANAEAAEKAAAENTKLAQQHLEKTQKALHETAGREKKYATEVKTADEAAREKHAGDVAKVQEHNARIQARHAEQRLNAMKKNKQTLAHYEDEVRRVQKENSDVLRDVEKRKSTEQKLNDASKQMQEKIETAHKKAKAEDDAAWNDWREKVGTTETPSGEIVNQINASKSVMDPEDVAEFRKVLKETKPTGAEVSELQSTRDSIAKQNGLGENYDKASPENKKAIDEIVNRLGLDVDETEAEATKPVDATRLHVWKTQLEYAVRSATRGNVRYAIGQVLDAVRKTEDQLSEEAGAGKELEKARALHGPYKDTFVNPPTRPQTVAGKSLAETSPEYAREQERAERLKMVGNYDPSIPQLAEHINNLREGLKALPEEAPLREKLKPLPAPPKLEEVPAPPSVNDMREGYRLQSEPTPPAPAAETVAQPERAALPTRPEEVQAERKVITPEEIQAERAEAVQKTAARRLREQGVRRAINALYYTVPTAVLSTLLGHPGYALTEVAMAPVILGGSHVLANLFERPEVVNWIARVTPKDLAAIEKMPPEERAVFAQNLGEVAKAAQQRRIPISPTLARYATSVAITATSPKTLKQLRETAQQRQQEMQTPETTTPEEPAETEPEEPESSEP
jgi:hypothetical protein